MTTPYDEGKTAGYCDAPNSNPYRKGIESLRRADAIMWAEQWDLGYVAGVGLAHFDLMEKRREACR